MIKTNSKKKVYWNGGYYNTLSKDVEVLKQQAPHLYTNLFPISFDSRKINNDKYHIYQVYYDESQLSQLRYGFKPYFNKEQLHNYENDIMLDIWRKREWVNAKYVGVLSWRLYEKTLIEKISFQKDVVLFKCLGYEKFDHPFSRKCFGSVNEMVRLADAYKLFPFKLDSYKVKYNVWCNYWVAKPHIFDDYCTNYLSKAIEFFKGTDLYFAKEKHRGQMVYAMTFFLEGLFSVYLTEKKYAVTEN